jgi:hypothetical protein
MKEKFLDYATVIRDGNDIDFKDLSLSDLRNHVPWYRGKKNGIYQVHNNKFSQIFYDLNEAIDKFLELRENYVTKQQS